MLDLRWEEALTRLVGYARVSTTDQEAGLSAQCRDLHAIGCVVMKERSSAVGERPLLEELLNALQPGEIVVVTKLDRLARNVHHLCEIVERIKAKGASLRILAMGLDTGTPTGTLMLNVLGAVAQFEREVMLERQREGIAKAKAAGKYKGSKPKVDHALVRKDVNMLIDDGWRTEAAMDATAAAHSLSTRQVQRIVRGK